MIKFIFKFVKKYKIQILLFFIFILISGMLSVFTPIVTGNIIDYITKKNEQLLLVSIKIFAFIQFTLIILNFIKNKLYVKLQTNIAFEIINHTIAHVQCLKIEVTEKYDKGYLNQRINNDSNALSSFALGLIGDFIINLLMLIFSTFILIKTNIMLGWILVCVGIVYIVIYKILKSQLYIVSMKLKEEQADFFSEMLKQLLDIKFIKIHSLIHNYQEKMVKSYKHYFKQVLNSQNLFFIYGSLDSIITVLANIGIFIIGGKLVISNQLTIGTFTIIISYFNYLIQSFKYFSSLGKNYQDTKASYNRLKELLDIEEENSGSVVIDDIKQITCKNLSFKRGNRIILANINQEFKKGYVYGIKGKNGAGKTTFLDLLIGLYPNSYTGEVKYNDTDIASIDMEALRSTNISYLEQNIVLLKGIVEDNILLTKNHGWDNVNNIIEECSEIKKQIKSLGDIKENKEGVSGGEGQKIGLLRAFAKNADVFILDEPTAFLDSKSTKYYMTQLIKAKQNKIIIIVSHDEDVLNMCDFVIKI